MSETTPKRGRPVGTEETPETLIRKELIAHLKIYRQLRELVQKKIEDGAASINVEELGKLMDLLRKGIVEMAKPIVAPAKADSSPKGEDEDPEKVLQSLLDAKR